VTHNERMVDIVHERLPQIQELCRKHRVARLWLFGSALTSTFDHDKSDVDFLVEWPNGDDKPFFELLVELERILGRNVDLVDKSVVKNPYFVEAVKTARVSLYAA
jgi:uncharacterized protein